IKLFILLQQISLLFLARHESVFFAFAVVICSGTKNVLSTTGNSEIQYNLMIEMYSGCEIVMGNLEITMMDHTRNFSFLQSIREVTGYILFAVNEFSHLPLDHLRVIRGTTLYEDQYALAVMVNYQKDGQHGLQELGLTHLTEILEGGVKIIQNKYLSYAPQVNWLDIVKDGTAHIMIEDNGPEKPCNEACEDLPCWGPENDTLTKTVCAPQCNSRCFGRNPSECCHIECAGGCTGPHDANCFACRNFNNSGACVPLCPQTLIYNKHTFKLEPNPNAKYQYGSICVAQCPPNFVVDGSSCVSNCPSDKMEVEKNGVKRCEPCGGLCPKACHGTKEGTARQTVDALNIDSFINCTKIQGSLHFLVTGIKGDDYNSVPALDPEKLKIFNTVREITGVFKPSFSGIQCLYFQTFSIRSLTSLGLRSLRKINDGGVYVTGNLELCYHDTVNWTRILTSGSRPQRRQKHIDVKENRPRDQCVGEGHVCDPLCSSDGCWGPGPNQCLSCKKYSRVGTCVPDCMFLTGERREFSTQSGECMPCHSECKVQEGKQTCTGPGADQCVACASLQDGPHCVSLCPDGVMGGEEVIFKYPNKQGSCEPCHINCATARELETVRGLLRTFLATTAIVLGVIALLFVSFSVFMLTVLYRRGLAIRRKRAMRRYMESGESFEPLDPGEKGSKVHARILKTTELRQYKLLGNGVFGSVHKGIWIPEGDTVKLPVAIKTIHDRTKRQTFYELTDHMMTIGSMDHINVVRTLGICPGASLQLVTQLSIQGSLLEHIRNCKNKLSPQRLLNWCVQIAKGMYYLEEKRMVHRNLAARNVLLKNNYTAQISDYGIADLLYPDDKKYFYNEVKTPIKWMALESILFRRYTHQSDVWSYGVTVWEMMSNGAEPYTAMRPQDVPDLLEKGERLSQPQICTIDVYMVMVKCWMIDENVRPTFKELANEFTRMARDPPRYLVIKVRQALCLSVLPPNRYSTYGFCGLNSSVYCTCNMLMYVLLLSTRRTVIISPSNVVGYLPMTPGVDNPGQAMWQSRSRLNSARTGSESSEGCGTAVELEMSEDFSLTGSLKRRRQREDSAYMSQRDSLSGGPPETPSPEMEEEDQNGYVLPGESPERGDSLLDDPDEEEYEYMNKQTCVTAVSPRHSNEAYEYEDMDSFVALRPGDAVVYHNLQRKGEGAVGDTEAHRSGFEPYVKVRAGVGVGEPTAGDRSFDNPDYWHSRMFLKPNAVPT
uniref:Receptor protein-tyrosine kinase n=1 Tax=Cyclopterus lumpus TaxID=8103 RepID=A0A8C3G5C6_CYCLU